MKHIALFTVACALAVSSLSSPAFAQKKEKKQQSAVTNMLKSLDLSEEQMAKIKEVAKEFDAKLAENTKAATDLLTEEQRKAKAEVMKKNKEEGIKGKEAAAAVAAALNLTKEQAAKTAELTKARAEILAEVRKQLVGVLSEEQLNSIPQLTPKKGKKKAA